MAGIGFELRKIYGRRTLSSTVLGSFYACLATIGPAVLFSLLLVILRWIIIQTDTPILETQFFMASFTALSMIGILTSAILSTVLSRFISDCIFRNDLKAISASLPGICLCTGTLAGLPCLGLAAGMYFLMGIHWLLCLLFYLTGCAVALAYTLMTYITSIKEYRKVTLCYLAGCLLALISSWIMKVIFQTGISWSLYVGLCLGFWFMNLWMLLICLKSFGTSRSISLKFLSYYRKYPKLLFSGSAYMTGFYLSILIYWLCSPASESIGVFRSMPDFELAMFLAIIVNMPALVIFTVSTETAFSDDYRQYLSAVNSAAYDRIEQERSRLTQSVSDNLFTVYEVQLIITIVLICLANVFFPYIGMSTSVLNVFSLLALAVYCVINMYFSVVMLYYFEDYDGAVKGPGIFLAVTGIGSFICALFIHDWYAVPLLAGGLVSWIVSFLVLRKRLYTLNGYMMCR